MMTSPGSYGGAILPAAYRGDLIAIYRSAQHLLALTEDVLDLARLEVGKLGLFREQVDVGQIIDEAVALVRDYVEAKGLKLILEVPSGLPTVNADRLRIRQVLLNLLTNAARLTDRGHVRVQVAKDEGYLRVSVEDSGPGIPPEDQARVFRLFVTQGKRTAEKGMGAGLGLPISKRFVELHGGEMGVESTVGVGSRFWFTLPLSDPKAGKHASTRAGLDRSVSEPPSPVVMLATGDRRTAQCLQRHLNGYRVEVADSYEEACRRALEARATAILADLTQTVDVESTCIPVVCCPLARTGRLAEVLGVAAYLVKPISREALREAIQGLGRPVRRVLIADDDTRFVRFLARLLNAEDRDFLIQYAHNGQEAIEKMLADPPDLLLLDLAMPSLDGIGVLSRMRSESALRKTAVIVVSAYEETEGTAPLGTEVRLIKPEGFRLVELTQVIGAALSHVSPPRAFAAPSEREHPAKQPG